MAEAGGSVPLYEEDFLRRPRRPSAQNAPKRAFATPRLFTLENRRVPPALPRPPAGPARHLTFALLVLCDRADGVATGNCSFLVNKLWRSELLCGNRRKSARNSLSPELPAAPASPDVGGGGPCVCSPSVNSATEVQALLAAGPIIKAECAGPSPSSTPRKTARRFPTRKAHSYRATRVGTAASAVRRGFTCVMCIVTLYVAVRSFWLKTIAMHNPPHPGSVLREYLGDIAVSSAAAHLRVTRVTLSRLLNGKAGISASMALRLADALGTSPDLWMNMQSQYDLWQASRRKRPSVQPLNSSARATLAGITLRERRFRGGQPRRLSLREPRLGS